MNFKDLLFGISAAEDEAVDFPELLLEGYYDPQDMPARLLDGPEFLVLGPKGSGKSALTEHLRLRAMTDSQLFVTRVELNNLHFRQFLGMVPGIGDRTSYPSAWEWLILISLFSSFAQDEGAYSNSSEDYRRTIRALDVAGYLPKDRLDLDQLITRSTTEKFAIKLPGLELGAEETRRPEGPNFFSALGTLKQVASQFMSDSRHLLVIDGLDTMFILEEVDWQILTALMVQVSSLNRMLRDRGTPASVIVLCRTDIYGRLPFADANKTRQNRGIELEWYPRSQRPAHSPLFRLAHKKASVHHPGVGNIVERFFPQVMELRSGRKMLIHEFLMELTRHRPRDLLSLLLYIQKASPRTGAPSALDVDEGARRYSLQYFVPEIRSELHGLLPQSEAFNALGLLKSMGGHKFYLHELNAKAKSDSRYSDIDVPAVLEQLFACGAVGNIASGGREPFYDFSYRNPEIDFDPDKQLIIHNGLILGLNIPRQVVR